MNQIISTASAAVLLMHEYRKTETYSSVGSLEQISIPPPLNPGYNPIIPERHRGKPESSDGFPCDVPH
jgi:hypothetical protein